VSYVNEGAVRNKGENMSRSFIKTQKTRERKGSAGEYERWHKDHPTKRLKGNGGDKFDLMTEDARANSDSLREDEAMYANGGPSTPRLLFGEAVEHLQGRQKEVYLLTMREGKSLAEAAEILNIEKGTAQKYRERAIKFIESYCKIAIQKGRI
jgi:DNA-directed RNA polymerase specialized sigma24 family protein